MIGRHRVSVIVGGQEVDGWMTYTIQTSLLVPSDGFNLTRPFDREAWELCRPDAEISVLVDGVAIITGYIDDVVLPPESDDMTITGRDKIGRLVQESSPAFEFAGLSTVELIKKIASPWFTEVDTENTTNRRIIRGKKGKIAASSPVVFKTKKSTGARIEPGQMRWAAIETILKQTGDLAISSGDGKSLIVFSPTSEQQEAQFRFFRPAPGSRRGGEGNCLMGETRSVGDLYSRIDVVGSGVGDANRYGISVSARTGNARDSELTEDGTGDRFLRPKRLLMTESVRSIKEAQELAAREMARRRAGWLQVPVIAPTHGQQIQGGRDVTLFACDTIATVENEQTGLAMDMRITSCQYTSSRDEGEQTRMDLVPATQELFL